MSAKKKQTEPAVKEVTLSMLAPRPGARKTRKRLGIGEGSGNGKTCGHGQKGQRSRSGYSQKMGFEGGQMPLHRRLPKVGFTSRKKVFGVNRFQVVDVDSLFELLEQSSAKELTIADLHGSGLVRDKSRVKILAGGEVKKKLVVEAHAVSASAKAAIEAAGGEVRIVK